MVILGVLLLVVAAVVLVDIGVASHGTMDVHLLGWHLGTYGPGRLLVLGALIGVALTLGLMLVLSGQLRSRRKRRARDKTIKGTRAENKRLAAQLEQQRVTGADAVAAAEPGGHAGRHHDARHDDDTHVSTGDVEAYPAEPSSQGAEYVLGSRHPQESARAHTPPAPPSGG
ncbi:hypothetical protein acdb102_11570 [Acidothermaceae bacterium B102]|nr:hypothetical protein acdb102_11570 [Acidothermaceae bacterium B102]